MSFAPKQLYKNRAEAYRLFIAPQNLPVKQAKFYQDCDRLKMVGTDKTIELSMLIAYTEDELKVSASTGQSLVDRSRDEERSHHEDRKAKAEADIKEMQAENDRRKMDERWLHRDEAWAALAGLIGTLRDTLRHHFHIGSSQLITLSGGDQQRAPEVYEGTEEILSRAFNEVVAAGRIEAIFAENHTVEEDP
ncbi:MAG TPA: hypothetical protein DCP69_10240 [Candidatus Omnitrophica bacterium]|nr:hypothetical protein [Candidatus Omnitrophota bacterium]